MIFEAVTPETSKSWWEEFWDAVVSFFLDKDEKGLNYLSRIGIAIAIIVIAYFLIKLLIHFIKKAFGIKKKGPDVDVSAKFFIVTIIKAFLWIGVAILVIAVLKIDTTGIAGITSAITVALGLALQDLIVGFASGAVVIHQHHIATGDFIGVTNSYGTAEGTVYKIHMFLTYLRTPAGQEITIPNSNMLKAVVTNYSRTGRRRLDYDVGVSYDTDIELAKKVFMDLVKDDPRIYEGEVPVVYVYELGAYSVGIRIRVVTKYQEYWNMYNEMSEKVLLACRENGIYIPSSTDRQIMK